MENHWRGSEKERGILRQARLYIVKLTPLWLILLSPFYLFPNPTRSLALLALPLLWLFQKAEKGCFIRRTPLDWPMLTILLMILVSLFATFDLHFSLPKLSGLLFHIAIFYAVAETVKTRCGLNRSLVLYFLLSLAVVGLGLIGTDWRTKIGWVGIITNRMPSLLQGLPSLNQGIDANQLAGTLLWFFPLSLSIAWYARQTPAKTDLLVKYSSWLWPLTALFGGLFILTQSRGGWLAGFCAMLYFGSILYRWVRWLAAATIAALLIFVITFDSSFLVQFALSDPAETALGTLNTLEFRFEVWQAALWGIADFPFTGMGLGTFRAVAPLLYPMNIEPGYDIAHAHNQFLQAALDLGLLGLVAYCALWFTTATLLFRVIVKPSDLFLKSVAVGISSCLVGYFVYALSDLVALGAKPGLFWWWLLALSIGAYNLNKQQEANND